MGIVWNYFWFEPKRTSWIPFYLPWIRWGAVLCCTARAACARAGVACPHTAPCTGSASLHRSMCGTPAPLTLLTHPPHPHAQPPADLHVGQRCLHQVHADRGVRLEPAALVRAAGGLEGAGRGGGWAAGGRSASLSARACALELHSPNLNLDLPHPTPPTPQALLQGPLPGAGRPPRLRLCGPQLLLAWGHGLEADPQLQRGRGHDRYALRPVSRRAAGTPCSGGCACAQLACASCPPASTCPPAL